MPTWSCRAGTPMPASGLPPQVAIVFGDYSYMESPGGEGASARTFMQTVRHALDAVGVRYTVISDMTVETGGLPSYKVAIFPYNFVMPEAEQAAVESYVAQGGRIIVFYAITDRMAALLGLRKGERREGDFQAVKLGGAGIGVPALQGLPDHVTQNSWNVLPVEPIRPDTEIIGEWVDGQGKPTGVPGLLISPNGAYFGHVLTEVDLAAKGRMLLAILGRFVPDIWQETSGKAAADAADTIAAMAARVLARSDTGLRQRGQSELDRARAGLAESERLASSGRHAEAIAAAVQAQSLAKSAVVLSAPERQHEFRGVWLHDAYGVPGWGWERTARELRDAGFNAIIANMLWAGLANYPSDYLPASSRVASEGDQIEQALRWCQQYGIELHVWKVNHNLANAPAEFVQGLREEGRLQRRRDGSEVLWLCPSDPRNFALERDSMLEVVQKYGVAGIHFDYIRYPDNESCYCDGCRQRFAEATGATIQKWPDDVLEGPLAEQYAQWRRDQITRLVRAVATEARRIRPGIMVSAAVFSWPGAINWVGQDWRQWVNEGLLDFVCPMNYTADPAELEQMVTSEVSVVQGRIPLYIGIGEFIIPETYQLVDQIERARHLGADGFVCFSYEHLGRAEGRLAELHEALTAHATSPPHPAPRAAFELPPAEAGKLGPVYPRGTPVQVAASLHAEANYAAPVRSASGIVAVETTDGKELERLGPVAADGSRGGPWTLSLPPGLYRFAVLGRATVGSSPNQEFVIRSQPFEVAQ